METFSTESNPARRGVVETYCGLRPLSHMRLSALFNVIVLVLIVVSLNISHWFSFQGSEYSLTGINLKEAGGWQSYADFRTRCKDEALADRPDYKDDCEHAEQFEFAGVICLVFFVLGMCLQVFNIASVISLAFSLSRKLQHIDFTHLMGPITYAFAMVAWVSLVKVAFLNSFRCSQGLILALTTVGLDFGVALHYRTFKDMLRPPSRPADSLMTY